LKWVGITSKGTAWEIMHSIWLLWMLPIGLFAWVGFFYIAFRTRQSKWFFWGLLYLTPLSFAAVLGDNEGLRADWSTYLGYYILMAWVGSIVHGLKVRKEYLLRLEAGEIGQQRREEYQDAELRQQITEEYSLGGLGDLPSTTTDPPGGSSRHPAP
jgi:hypothetical protein